MKFVSQIYGTSSELFGNHLNLMQFGFTVIKMKLRC